MLLTDDTDFVNGMKMTRSDPAYRVLIGNLHKFVTRWAFWLPINDVDCDFRLIRRSVLDASSCAATAVRSASSWSSMRSGPGRSSAKCRCTTTRGSSAARSSSGPAASCTPTPTSPRMWFVLMVAAPRIRRLTPLCRIRRVSRPPDASQHRYRAFYRDRRVLITGGLGFIGSNLARAARRARRAVLIVDSLIPDYGGNLFNIRGIEDRVRVEHRRHPAAEHDELPGARAAT